MNWRTIYKSLAILALYAASILAQDVNGVHRAALYEPLILDASNRHSVDPRLLWTIAWIETRFQPKAISPAGAHGLMQFVPATARRYRLRDPFDPAESIDAAARYLRDLQGMFGDRLDLILAAYNAGEGAVRAFREGRALKLSGGKIINPKMIRSELPPYRETIDYVSNGIRVFARLSGLRAPERLRLSTPQAPVITVDLEEIPNEILELKQGSVYAIDAPHSPEIRTIHPNNAATRSIYAR
jgi:soluble lytic murein transglycosylase-like protein